MGRFLVPCNLVVPVDNMPFNAAFVINYSFEVYVRPFLLSGGEDLRISLDLRSSGQTEGEYETNLASLKMQWASAH